VIAELIERHVPEFERYVPLSHKAEYIMKLRTRADVYAAFRHLGFLNKHVIAGHIAKHIPAFERYVPPARKTWMSEDSRMGLFDAAALALVFLQREVAN